MGMREVDIENRSVCLKVNMNVIIPIEIGFTKMN